MDRSTGYKDELCVAAMELYKATKDAKYLNDAKANFEGNDVAWALSWDDNHVMCEVSESCLPWIRLATIYMNLWTVNHFGINCWPFNTNIVGVNVINTREQTATFTV